MELNTPWRKIASTIYGPPRDSKLLGTMELDITEIDAFISDKRKKGLKITLTHFLALAIGKAIAHDMPQFNTYTARGKVFKRKHVTASVSVLASGNSELIGAKIEDVHLKSLKEISDELNEKIKNAKNSKEVGNAVKGDFLSQIPWPFRKIVFKTIRFLVVDLGISLNFIKINPESFGSFILSNIGSIGLDIGYGALMPASNLAIAFFIGKSEKKAVVVNDEIVIRKMLNLSASVDHRLVDGHHVGMLFRAIKLRCAEIVALEK